MAKRLECIGPLVRAGISEADALAEAQHVAAITTGRRVRIVVNRREAAP